MNSEVIQMVELSVPNGDLPVGGWVVRLEGALASIAIIAFFKDMRYEVRPRSFLIKAFQDEHLGGSESREERPGRLRLERT